MNLDELFQNIPAPKRPVAIRNLTTDSRAVEPGDLFLAHVGEVDDGRQYIAQAVKKGAAAIAYEASGEYVLPKTSVPCIPVEHLKERLGDIAAKFYGYPSQALKIFGITGTNGKTSTVYFLAQLFTHCGQKVGLLSTIGNGIYPHLTPSLNTTVGAVDIQKSLAAFEKAGCKYVCMEVSSHSIMQHRVNEVKFEAVVFTNLSRDHLDYHHDMEQYFQAKQRLFQYSNWTHAIVNADDAFGKRLLESLNIEKKSVIGYSLSSSTFKGPLALFSKIKTHPFGFQVMLSTPWGQGSCDILVLGNFNLSNVLSAVSVALSAGLKLEDILQAIPSLKMPKGRMEMIYQSGKPAVVIDFAHTSDALEKVLKALRPFCQGKLWCIFGCGGDRDEGKRSIMAHTVERNADYIVLTSDNPRGEPIERIMEQTRKGFTTLNKVYEETDRKKAIQYAITTARSNDMILIAGKGHETYQEINGIRYPFNEHREIKKIFEGLNPDEKSKKMNLSTVAQLLQASSLTNDAEFSSVSTDTRTLKQGDLFFAIKGEHFNGHTFIAQALAKGAIAAVVSETINSTLPLIKVNNTLEALGTLAHHYRLQMPAKVIAITGSCGKTTTRALTANIFSLRYKTLSSIRSFNNEIGVPLTLFNLKPSHQYAVLELGASHLKEIDTVVNLASPVDVAIITTIAPAHLSGFGSLDNIAQAKFEIVSGLDSNGILILPLSAYRKYWPDYKEHKILTFDSDSSQADVYAQNVSLNVKGQAGFDLYLPDGHCFVQLQLAGKHNVQNALAAAAAANSKQISLEVIKQGLETALPVDHRLNIFQGMSDAIVIDDAYNANPCAMKAAIDLLSSYDKKRILVMGDMLELGEGADQYHRMIGDYAREKGVQELFVLGELSQLAASNFGNNAHHYDTHESLIETLKSSIDSHTVVLIKGSFSMNMQKVVCALIKRNKN